MSNYFHLLKVSLIENFHLNKVFKRDKIISKILFVLLGFVIAGSVVFSIGSVYYFIPMMVANPNEALETILNTALSIVSLIMIVSTLLQAKGFLFKGNDFDLLVSMPIKLKTIVLSKISTLLIANYVGMLVGFGPAIVVIAMLGLTTKIMFYVLAVLIFLFFPLAIVSVFALISLLFSNIFRNFKYKNLLIIIFGLTLITVYFIYSFSMNSNNVIFLEIGKAIEYIYYPAVLAVNGLLGNYLHLGIFFVLNIILFILFINIAGKLYLKSNTGSVRKAKKINKTLTIAKSSQTKVLIKNEFKKYFSIPQYVINTIFGKVLLPIGLIVIPMQMGGLALDPTMSLDINVFIYLILALVAVLTVTLSSTTSVTLSLEGRQLWILKTIPVSTKQIFLSKMAVDLSTTLAGAVIGLVGVAILVPFNLIGFSLLTIFILSLGVHNAVLGLIINLKFPKLKWDLPVRVVKQSLSVLMHMLASFALAILLVMGVLLLSKTISNINLIFAMATAFVLLTAIAEIFVLNKYGDKWFGRL
ncbi:MAG: hypothetical protein WCY22_01555 [Acholeplasmataceae bacterium]